jgi:hypothetical protein
METNGGVVMPAKKEEKSREAGRWGVRVEIHTPWPECAEAGS